MQSANFLSILSDKNLLFVALKYKGIVKKHWSFLVFNVFIPNQLNIFLGEIGYLLWLMTDRLQFLLLTD